jgi:hypothetical protein
MPKKDNSLEQLTALDTDINTLKILLDTLSKKYQKSSLDLIRIAERKTFVPLIIFKQTRPLTAIVTFLKEECDFNLTQIGRILNRSTKTIWQAYNARNVAQKSDRNKLNKNKDKGLEKNMFLKSEKSSSYSKSSYDIPVEYFYKDDLSILESAVKFLKEENNLTLKKISVLLDRDQRTIWTTYHRAQKKAK